jgi:hypothetical protein
MVGFFISHSSKNNHLAAQGHGWLTADGHDVFLDNDRNDRYPGWRAMEETII